MTATAILMTTSGTSTVWSAVIPFLLAAALASITFFGLRALHRKRHPDQADKQETNRQRREREKLKDTTMRKVGAAISGQDPNKEGPETNGLRSGKYKKKKKK